jgi:hypothetical protein
MLEFSGARKLAAAVIAMIRKGALGPDPWSLSPGRGCIGGQLNRL